MQPDLDAALSELRYQAALSELRYQIEWASSRPGRVVKIEQEHAKAILAEIANIGRGSGAEPTVSPSSLHPLFSELTDAFVDIKGDSPEAMFFEADSARMQAEAEVARLHTREAEQAARIAALEAGLRPFAEVYKEHWSFRDMFLCDTKITREHFIEAARLLPLPQEGK